MFPVGLIVKPYQSSKKIAIKYIPDKFEIEFKEKNPKSKSKSIKNKTKKLLKAPL